MFLRRMACRRLRQKVSSMWENKEFLMPSAHKGLAQLERFFKRAAGVFKPKLNLNRHPHPGQPLLDHALVYQQLVVHEVANPHHLDQLWHLSTRNRLLPPPEALVEKLELIDVLNLYHIQDSRVETVLDDVCEASNWLERSSLEAVYCVVIQ